MINCVYYYARVIIMNKIQIGRKQVHSLPIPQNPNYKHDIATFNAWLNNEGRVISSEALEEFFSHLQNEGLKPSTIKRYKSSIRRSMKELLGEHLTKLQNESIDAFFRTIKITSDKDEKGITENEILSSDELKALLNASGHKTSLIIQALFETACRVSELCSIRLSNCKRFKAGMEIRIIGKGNKSRNVYMSYDLYKAIRDTYEGRVYLFESGRKPLSRITVHTLIKRAGLKIGRYDIHAHTLRHTFATINITKLGLPKVSKYLGHSSINVTTSFYLHGKASLNEVLTCTKEILGE